MCGSNLTNNLGKYLGIPLIHSRVTKHTYAPIIDRVQSKLARWNSNTLNLAGRLTLLQYVTSIIYIYVIQIAKLSTSVYNSFDKLNRNFLWGSSNNVIKIHLLVN